MTKKPSAATNATLEAFRSTMAEADIDTIQEFQNEILPAMINMAHEAKQKALLTKERAKESKQVVLQAIDNVISVNNNFPEIISDEFTLKCKVSVKRLKNKNIKDTLLDKGEQEEYHIWRTLHVDAEIDDIQLNKRQHKEITEHIKDSIENACSTKDYLMPNIKNYMDTIIKESNERLSVIVNEADELSFSFRDNILDKLDEIIKAK